MQHVKDQHGCFRLAVSAIITVQNVVVLAIIMIIYNISIVSYVVFGIIHKTIRLDAENDATFCDSSGICSWYHLGE